MWAHKCALAFTGVYLCLFMPEYTHVQMTAPQHPHTALLKSLGSCGRPYTSWSSCPRSDTPTGKGEGLLASPLQGSGLCPRAVVLELQGQCGIRLSQGWSLQICLVWDLGLPYGWTQSSCAVSSWDIPALLLSVRALGHVVAVPAGFPGGRGPGRAEDAGRSKRLALAGSGLHVPSVFQLSILGT